LGASGLIWVHLRTLPPTIASPSPLRIYFHKSLAFQALESHHCDDRAERGTKENEHDAFYD
jgi:hypothetical protein